MFYVNVPNQINSTLFMAGPYQIYYTYLLENSIASQCLGEFCLFFKVIPFCLSAPFAATLIHSFVNKKNFQPRSFTLNNILLFSSFCGFMSTRILPYFALSVFRSSSVTYMTSQLFSKILWLRP